MHLSPSARALALSPARPIAVARPVAGAGGAGRATGARLGVVPRDALLQQDTVSAPPKVAENAPPASVPGPAPSQSLNHVVPAPAATSSGARSTDSAGSSSSSGPQVLSSAATQPQQQQPSSPGSPAGKPSKGASSSVAASSQAVPSVAQGDNKHPAKPQQQQLQPQQQNVGLSSGEPASTQQANAASTAAAASAAPKAASASASGSQQAQARQAGAGQSSPPSSTSSQAASSAPTATSAPAQPAAASPSSPSTSPVSPAASAQAAPSHLPSSPAASSPVPAPQQQTSPTVPSTQATASSSTQTFSVDASITSASSGFQLKPMHFVIFTALFVGGAVFATITLQFTAEMNLNLAMQTVARRVLKSVAFRQLCVIATAILVVRFGLNSVLKTLSRFSNNPIQWEKSKLFYVLREVYQPLELLLFIAAVCTLADAFVPQLIAVPKSTVASVVRSILSVSFIFGTASVVFNLKSRFCKENAWQSEMSGDVTSQRRWEAYDKLGTFVIYAVTFVLGIQALGLEVTSVLAIGGIGGLAIGLAGREICENILNGFLIMSTSPFEVGDEVHFFHPSKVVEGMVMDIGWYRTTIRSYEREVFVVPNAVFSKNIVLNITRKNREWRFFEMLCVRVQDVHKVNTIVKDIRNIVRNDSRIITKLHRRIFFDKITHEDCKIYVSFYVEASNREAFMAVKQDLLLAFVDCIERNGAKLAVPRVTLDAEAEALQAAAAIFGAASVMAAKHAYDQQQGSMRALPGQGGSGTGAATAAAAAAAAGAAAGQGSGSGAVGGMSTIMAEATPVSSGSGSPSGSTKISVANAPATTATTEPAAPKEKKDSSSPKDKKDGGSGSGNASGGGDGSGVVSSNVVVAAGVSATPVLATQQKGGLEGLLQRLAHIIFE